MPRKSFGSFGWWTGSSAGSWISAFAWCICPLHCLTLNSFRGVLNQMCQGLFLAAVFVISATGLNFSTWARCYAAGIKLAICWNSPGDNLEQVCLKIKRTFLWRQKCMIDKGEKRRFILTSPCVYLPRETNIKVYMSTYKIVYNIISYPHYYM